MGSLWAWGARKEAKEVKEDKEVEEKVEAKSAMSGGFGMMSAAFGKMPGFGKATEKEEGGEKEEEDGEKKEGEGENKPETKTSYLASSFGAGLSSIKSSLTMENLYAATGATTATMQEEMEGVAVVVGENMEEVEGEEKVEGAEDWGMSFSQAFSKVGKMTSDYTKGRIHI